MVTKDSIESQLKRIGFNIHGWGRTEAHELPNIILPDEEILDAVNGIYEGGFALCVATDVRVLLIDKKPLNYLTVEDLRFDMINEIDYSHRLFGARITISTGPKTLRFMSFNQQRLRRLIGHVQHRMAEVKKKQHDHEVEQKSHLEQINQQLQAYLLAQHQHQQDLQQQLSDAKNGAGPTESKQGPKPAPELSDYLFARSLLAQSGDKPSQDMLRQIKAVLPQTAEQPEIKGELPATTSVEGLPPAPKPRFEDSPNPNLADLYEEGMKEIFGSRRAAEQQTAPVSPQPVEAPQTSHIIAGLPNPLEVNALKIAYSKLPMALRNRKFGSPSFHAHSQSPNNPRAAGAS
jgi:hypothetical protein